MLATARPVWPHRTAGTLLAPPVQAVSSFADPFAAQHSETHRSETRAGTTAAAPATRAGTAEVVEVSAHAASASAAASAPATAADPFAGMSAEDADTHRKAQRFARLLVDEIKLYNQAKVAEGRRNKDLYDRLKEDIDKEPFHVSEALRQHRGRQWRLLSAGSGTQPGRR
jgi:hypothetical protein